LGTWKIDEALTPQMVETAIGFGYRLIDTAANYRNESGIGLALAKSSLPRALCRNDKALERQSRV
jgi:2,5-diketo-D-gluconate reductase A